MTELTKLTLVKRKQFQDLIEDLAPYSKKLLGTQFANETELMAYTIDIWLEEIEKAPKDGRRVAGLLRNYLKESEHDGITYSDNCPAHLIAQDFKKKTFGDCATIALMRVPNHKKELIRALLTYPENKQALMTRIKQEIRIGELNSIIDSLIAEKSLPPKASASTGYNEGHSLSSIESSYSSTYVGKEYDNLCAFRHVGLLFPENAGQEKSALLENLKTKIIANGPPLTQMSEIFNLCNLNADLFNSHRNPGLDRFFGINNTKSWGSAVKEIRQHALTKLFSEVVGKTDLKDKISLLEWAKGQPLFNQHRSNFILTGAWGNTAAVSAINIQLSELTKARDLGSSVTPGL